LPKRVLARLDAKAKAFGQTRSGFIAHMTISAWCLPRHACGCGCGCGKLESDPH